MLRLLVALLAAATVIAGTNKPSWIFVEDFEGEVDVFTSGKWVKSIDPKYQDQPILVKPPTKGVVGFEADKGVQLTQEMKHYGFGARFSSPLLFDRDEVVIQYELKLEERLNCGGAYIKLLRDRDVNLEQLNNESPYTIMFGPDKCGTDSRLHFILKYLNPVTKQWSEHHYDGHIKPKIDRSYHVYTLVLRKDNTFEVYIDTKSVAQGSLLQNLAPPINPPAEIDDPRDFKPSTWIGQPMMYDTSAVKPEDWDESQPKKIVDIHASKPASWDETVPVTVPDPTVSKPSDWADEEDGDWEAPQLPNPLCDTVGCGPWTPPLIRNPLYRGKWVPPIIPNPEYKGPWTPRKIPNRGYFNEPDPYSHIAPMYAVAVEVWTISAGILYDNFYIGHSLSDALAYAKNTTGRKAQAERALQDKENHELDLEARLEVLETGTLVERLTVRVEMAVEHLKEHPKMFFYALAVFVFTVVYSRLTGGSQEKERKKVKKGTQ